MTCQAHAHASSGQSARRGSSYSGHANSVAFSLCEVMTTALLPCMYFRNTVRRYVCAIHEERVCFQQSPAITCVRTETYQRRHGVVAQLCKILDVSPVLCATNASSSQCHAKNLLFLFRFTTNLGLANVRAVKQGNTT